MRFDWYQGTVVAPPAAVLEAVAGLPGRWESLSRPAQGYGFGERRHDASGRVCDVLWGGVHELPHVIASGETAPQVAGLLRSRFPHRVSRADVCLDYGQAGAYDRLQSVQLELARERGIKVDTRGDHLVTLEGRSLYLGSPSACTRTRLYDKRAETLAKLGADVASIAELPEHWTRLEVQVRPQTREAKAAAADLEPAAFWGSAAWTRALMAKVEGLSIEPFKVARGWRQSDDERAWHACLAQYGAMLTRRKDEHGDWACLGLQIGQDLADRERFPR